MWPVEEISRRQIYLIVVLDLLDGVCDVTCCFVQPQQTAKLGDWEPRKTGFLPLATVAVYNILHF